jgi:hypothetical protein
MKMKMYALLDKGKPHIENIEVLNLAAVTCTIAQMSKLLWYFELTLTCRA